MATTAKKPRVSRAQDERAGRVILHVYVEPEVRRCLHILARSADVDANGVLKAMVREGLSRKGFPIPKEIAAN